MSELLWKSVNVVDNESCLLRESVPREGVRMVLLLGVALRTDMVGVPDAVGDAADLDTEVDLVS